MQGEIGHNGTRPRFPFFGGRVYREQGFLEGSTHQEILLHESCIWAKSSSAENDPESTIITVQ